MCLKLIFCISLLSFNLLSQDQIEWQEPIKGTLFLNKIFKTNATDHFTVGSDGKGLGEYQYYISYFKNNILQESQKIVESNDMNYFDAIMINNTLYVLYEANNDLKHTLYIQKFDETCKPISELNILAEVMGEGKLNYNTFYSISQSKNEQFLCLDYRIKNDLTTSYGYKIFSNDFKIISQGEQQLPYVWDESKVISKHLTNSGKYFIIINVYEDPKEDNSYLKSLGQKKILLHEVANGGLSEGYDISMADNRISDIIIASDDNDILTLSGMYIEKEKIVPNTMGYFCKRINPELTKTIFSYEEKIDQYLLMSNLSDDQEEERKNPKLILRFKNRELLFMPDSSIILILEQCDATALGANQQASTAYQYNELFVFKINPKGKRDWKLKIPKAETLHFNESVSTHFSIVKENELILLFRDHDDSYNNVGEWNSGSEEMYSDMGNAYKYVKIAKASINLKTAQVKRTIYLSTPPNPLIPRPHLFKFDELNNTLLIVMDNPYGKGEQYGVVQY